MPGFGINGKRVGKISTGLIKISGFKKMFAENEVN